MSICSTRTPRWKRVVSSISERTRRSCAPTSTAASKMPSPTATKPLPASSSSLRRASKEAPARCAPCTKTPWPSCESLASPIFFITMTCNPNWAEITRELEPGQDAKDRPDLVCRVFHMKLQELFKDIFDRGVLGRAAAYTYSIEYQKRGLPHAHILLILDRNSKISPDDMDKYVCAEIPDPVTQPELHKIVTSSLIHTKCEGDRNARCMKDGACSKGFPKAFASRTEVPDDGYALYRRRSPEDGGRTFSKRSNGRDTLYDNRYRPYPTFPSHRFPRRWVVPYNPYLTKKYNTHINVEFCASVKAVKYLFKYVLKGHDEATLSVRTRETVNEIKEYVHGRYVCATRLPGKPQCPQ